MITKIIKAALIAAPVILIVLLIFGIVLIIDFRFDAYDPQPVAV